MRAVPGGKQIYSEKYEIFSRHLAAFYFDLSIRLDIIRVSNDTHHVHALYFTQFDTYKQFYSPWYEKTNQKPVKLDERLVGVTCAIPSQIERQGTYFPISSHQITIHKFSSVFTLCVNLT